MPEIIDSGANIHPAKKFTTTMVPVIISYDMKARIPDGTTMESSQIATLQLLSLSKQYMQIHIFTKNQNSPTNIIGILV